MFKLLKFGIKAGILSSTVYYTVDQGVWSDSETTTQLYGKLYQLASPYVTDTIKEIPVEMPDLPRVENITHFVKNSWNQGVITSCIFLGDLPTKSWNFAKEYSKIGYSKVTELLNDNTSSSEGAKQSS